MEGLLLGAGSVALLVGLGALVEATRPQQGWKNAHLRFLSGIWLNTEQRAQRRRQLRYYRKGVGLDRVKPPHA